MESEQRPRDISRSDRISPAPCCAEWYHPPPSQSRVGPVLVLLVVWSGVLLPDGLLAPRDLVSESVKFPIVKGGVEIARGVQIPQH